MTPAQLAAIRERGEKATPEPGTCKNRVGYVFSQSPDADCVVANCGDFADKELVRFNGARWNADATFIAASRQDVPDLVGEVERLRKALEIISHRGSVFDAKGTYAEATAAIARAALEAK